MCSCSLYFLVLNVRSLVLVSMIAHFAFSVNMFASKLINQLTLSQRVNAIGKDSMTTVHEVKSYNSHYDEAALSGESSDGLSLTIENASWTQTNICKRFGSTFEAQHCLRAIMYGLIN